MTLPPGQHAIDGFPRFGTHFAKPPPAVPDEAAVEVGGAVTAASRVPLADLAPLARRELDADFHCVAGWTAIGLRWEGVAFSTFYETVVEPRLLPGAVVTHVRFGGLDGYHSVVLLEDALADDVLLADRLGGRPLDADHGAPLRLVSPRQYGFINTKHLCRIEVLTAEPAERYRTATRIAQQGLRALGFTPHPRARVWEEERGGVLPNAVARPLYRVLTPPIAKLSARGGSSGAGTARRLPASAHTGRPWRIHEVAPDFRLEDVWALPTPGGPDDFRRLVDHFASGAPEDGASGPARALWAIRWKLGELLGWDDPDAGLGGRVATLRDRLPADLRDGPSGPEFDGAPFSPVFLTGDEWAAEIANRTVHGVLHLGWVPDGDGGHHAQMAVLVKPNGLLGETYMAAIRPFRHTIVYPPLLRDIGRRWKAAD